MKNFVEVIWDAETQKWYINECDATHTDLLVLFPCGIVVYSFMVDKAGYVKSNTYSKSCNGAPFPKSTYWRIVRCPECKNLVIQEPESNPIECTKIISLRRKLNDLPSKDI